MRITGTTILHTLLCAVFLSMVPLGASGQDSSGPPVFDPYVEYRVRPYYGVTESVVNGDTIPVVHMKPMYVFRRPLDTRRYERMIRNLKAVYPIARYANQKLLEMEEELSKMPNPKDQQRYAKQVEKELKEQYTPILKKMSLSQGKMLIKLIDRETGRTSYDLVKDMRGSFRAFFWQGIARMFGANLKDTYDGEGDDKILEELILLYEAGML